jgi:hypothetical protein
VASVTASAELSAADVNGFALDASEQNLAFVAMFPDLAGRY